MEEIAKTECTEVLSFAGYQEFEQAADRTALKIKEGFMEMGYILKIARDTQILAGSEYRNVEDFAQKRYDLDKGTVSRYIRIVERFSEGGCTHILRENYKQMGFAKLSLMLHMPDSIAEELLDTYSKQEIQEIKEEIDAEKEITDIEVAIEAAAEETDEEQENENSLCRALRQMGKEQRNICGRLHLCVNKETDRERMKESILDILAPAGDAIIMVRIPGTGRQMIAITDGRISVTNTRTGEKDIYTEEDLAKAAYNVFWGINSEEEPEEEPEETKAPEEPKKENKKQEAPKKRKDSRVTKAKQPKKQEAKEPEAPKEEIIEQPDEQAEGQMNTEDYPEAMPEELGFLKVAPVQLDERKENEGSDTERMRAAEVREKATRASMHAERLKNKLDGYMYGREISEQEVEELLEITDQIREMIEGMREVEKHLT